MTQMTLENTLGVHSFFVVDVRASINRPAPRTTLHAPRTRSAAANSVRRSGVNGYRPFNV